MDDLISRQAAIDEMDEWIKAFLENGHKESAADACLIQDGIIQLPSAPPEYVTCYLDSPCEYQNKSVALPEQANCEYCHEDSDGFVRPIEKNSHVWLVRRGRTMKLRVGFKGGYSECDILFCPMCGRRLTDG